MSDGQGYYAYLPATFIYHDLSLQFVWQINDTYYPGEKAALYVNNTPHGPINKYFVGTAVMQAPFFLVAHALTKLSEYPADGYSPIYQLGVGVAGVFYACLGVWFLFGLLNNQGYSSRVSALTAALALFATNLMYYAVYEPSMSHVYSFCAVSALLYSFAAFTKTEKPRHLVVFAAALGLTVLIRPINGLVVLSLPMLAGNWSGFKQLAKRIFRRKQVLFGVVAITAAVASVQPIIYFLQTGHPFIWPYGDEGFNFLSPEIMNVLFSYRRGLFIYSPILFLALIGFVVGARQQPFKNLWALFFISVIVWVISSWWMWYYGGSFGHRAFIEFIPVFSLGLAGLIQRGIGIIRPPFVMATCLLFTILQQVQTYQYQKQILPYDGITETKYWNLFLRTGKDLQYYYAPALGDGSYSATDSTVLLHHMDEPMDWGNEHLLSDEDAYSGRMCSKMGGTDQYGITFRYSPSNSQHLINTIRVRARIKSNSTTTDLAFICTVEDSAGHSKYWSSRLLRPQLPWGNRWGIAASLFTLPFPCDPTDRITVFPMKSDDATVFIDDMEISLIKVTGTSN